MSEPEVLKCPKCGGEIEIGYLANAWNWTTGKSLWKNPSRKRVFGYACKKCGYIEFYREREKMRKVLSHE